MRRLVLVAFALGLTVLVAVGCGSVPQGAIATVGGVPITKAQFDHYINQAAASAGESGKSAFPSPGTAAYERYAPEAVNFLVQQQVILNAARSLKITVTDQQVQAQLAQMAAQYGGVQKLYAAAQKAGLNTAQLTAYVRDSMIGEMVYQKVTSKITPTEQQMQAYYKANKAQFDQPATRTVRHILVKTKAAALTVRALWPPTTPLPPGPRWPRSTRSMRAQRTAAATSVPSVPARWSSRSTAPPSRCRSIRSRRPSSRRTAGT